MRRFDLVVGASGDRDIEKITNADIRKWFMAAVD